MVRGLTLFTGPLDCADALLGSVFRFACFTKKKCVKFAVDEFRKLAWRMTYSPEDHRGVTPHEILFIDKELKSGGDAFDGTYLDKLRREKCENYGHFQNLFQTRQYARADFCRKYQNNRVYIKSHYQIYNENV